MASYNSPKTINAYRPPPKGNERAVLALASWSDACGIAWEKSSKVENDLTMIDSAGRRREVVVIHKPHQTILPDTLTIPAWDLTASNHEIAFAAFHKLTEALGHGKPIPVNRGAEPQKKLCYKDDMELVGMRHGLLRLSPNVSTATAANYTGVIEGCTKYYYYKFKRFFDLFGYKLDDLISYSNMWFLIFHHNYRKLYGTLDENKKILTRYIQQSFINFGQAVQSKADGCFPEGENLQVALYENSIGHPPLRVDGAVIFTTEHKYNQAPAAEEDAGYQERHALINKDSAAKRRKSAASVLAEHLSRIPCPKLGKVLLETAENEFFDYDTQMEARRQLRIHGKDCSVCPKVDEEVSGGNSSGA